MATFSERLRSLRAEKDLTRQALSNLIGITHSSINMYERGEREPGLETLEIIADFFNVDMDYLLGRQDVPRKIDFSHISSAIPVADTSNLTNLTKHEHKVLTSYRKHPEMQPAVDRLLGIEPEEEEFETAARRSDGKKIKMTKEQAIALAKSGNEAPNDAHNKEMF